MEEEKIDLLFITGMIFTFIITVLATNKFGFLGLINGLLIAVSILVLSLFGKVHKKQEMENEKSI